MDVGMTALAVASLTSVALGLVLCLFFCVFRFGIKLFLPMQSRKWMREVWTFFKVVFSFVAILLFLYATNRGVFRWFLTAGVIAACLLTDRLLGRRLSRAGDGVTARVRRSPASTIRRSWSSWTSTGSENILSCQMAAKRPLVSQRYQGAFLFYFYFKVFRT